jgi:hypothetical protein
MKIMDNIYLIPTDKPSKLSKHSSGTFHIVENKPHKKGLYKMTNQYIYITSDEVIKEGDWYYWAVTNSVQKAKKDSFGKLPENSDGSNKIILTTDPQLIKDGVQAIDDEFLKWFVKHPSCESVKYYTVNSNTISTTITRYEIIIPKETKESIATRLEEIDLDRILDNACKEHMIQFDLESFKNSHPRLYKSIKNAMKNAIVASNGKIDG